MSGTLMKCGHTAQGNMFDDGREVPVCVICDCKQVAEDNPSLEGRIAKCSDCNNTEPSKFTLPFFKHQPEQANDRYYCGCYGWD